MRTANPFDGRAFVRSRNDVNPKRRGRREGGPKPPRDFCKLPIIDRGSEADCPSWPSGSGPIPLLFLLFISRVAAFINDCSKEEGGGEGEGEVEGRERVGDRNIFFSRFPRMCMEPWGKREREKKKKKSRIK